MRGKRFYLRLASSGKANYSVQLTRNLAVEQESHPVQGEVLSSAMQVLGGLNIGHPSVRVAVLGGGSSALESVRSGLADSTAGDIEAEILAIDAQTLASNNIADLLATAHVLVLGGPLDSALAASKLGELREWVEAGGGLVVTGSVLAQAQGWGVARFDLDAVLPVSLPTGGRPNVGPVLSRRNARGQRGHGWRVLR